MYNAQYRELKLYVHGRPPVRLGRHLALPPSRWAPVEARRSLHPALQARAIFQLSNREGQNIHDLPQLRHIVKVSPNKTAQVDVLYTRAGDCCQASCLTRECRCGPVHRCQHPVSLGVAIHQAASHSLHASKVDMQAVPLHWLASPVRSMRVLCSDDQLKHSRNTCKRVEIPVEPSSIGVRLCLQVSLAALHAPRSLHVRQVLTPDAGF